MFATLCIYPWTPKSQKLVVCLQQYPWTPKSQKQTCGELPTPIEIKWLIPYNHLQNTVVKHIVFFYTTHESNVQLLYSKDVQAIPTYCYYLITYTYNNFTIIKSHDPTE